MSPNSLTPSELPGFVDWLKSTGRLAELDRLLPRPPLWEPQPGPQAAAYDSPADVLGYGGAAGGGKSDLILGLAVTRHRRSLILRRESVSGRGLIDRARELLGALGRF